MINTARSALQSIVMLTLFIFSCTKGDGPEAGASWVPPPTPIEMTPRDTLVTAQFQSFTLGPWDYDHRTGTWKRNTFDLPYKAVVSSLKVFIAPASSSNWLQVPHVSQQTDLYFAVFNNKIYLDVYETQFHLMDFNNNITVKVNYQRYL